jgi:hypothetical protein
MAKMVKLSLPPVILPGWWDYIHGSIGMNPHGCGPLSGEAAARPNFDQTLRDCHLVSEFHAGNLNPNRAFDRQSGDWRFESESLSLFN